MDNKSLAHTKWNCKYHIVFAPQYRRQAINGKIKEDVGIILRKLCEQKGVEILEAKACVDHVQMVLMIPPKLGVSAFMGYLKGKSTLMIFDRHANLKYKKECDTLKMVKVKDAYALVLVEHQSRVNHLMPYRILEYMTKIWQNYIKDQEQVAPNISERKDFKLPPIIPILYHTGKGNWTVKSEFKEKIEHSNLFQDFIPSFNYGIISLNKLTYDDLKQKGTAIGLAMMLMKTDDENDLKKFKEILSDENYIEKINSSLTKTQKEDLKIVFERQLEANNVSEEQKNEILESFNLGGAKMFNKWFDMQEVEKKGIEKGIEENTKKIVFKLLERDDIDEVAICELADIDVEKLEELKELHKKIEHENFNEETEDIDMSMM